MSGRKRRQRGGDAERFAYIPESLLESEAGKTLPHAAFKVLTVLIVGRSKDRNGTACCSESYAAKYGISKNTVGRSLLELQQRGIIVITRRVQKFKKHPTLFGVTWWPITHRDGEPLIRPEPASYAYLKWSITPTAGVQPTEAAVISSPPPWGDLTPTIGVEGAVHHPHLDHKSTIYHPHGDGQSLDLGMGAHTVSDGQDSEKGVNGAPAPAASSPDPDCSLQDKAANRKTKTRLAETKKVGADVR